MKVSKRWQSFSFWLKHPFKSWCALSCMPLFTSQAPSTSFFLFCPFSVWSPWICTIPPFSSLVCACCNPSPSPPAPGVVVLSGLHCLRNHSCSSSLSTSFNAPHPWTTSTTTFLFSIPARLVRVCNASFILWCSFTLTLRFHHPPSVLQPSLHISSLSVLWMRPNQLDFQLRSPPTVAFSIHNMWPPCWKDQLRPVGIFLMVQGQAG